MKFLSLFLLLCCGAAFAMQQGDVTLDNDSLQEFIRNKQRMIEVSKETVVNPNQNTLFCAYQRLSTLDAVATRQECTQSSLATKIKSFYAFLNNQPTYQTGLHVAKTVNTDEVWDNFRKGNGPLFRDFLAPMNIFVATRKCSEFFNNNARLGNEQVEYVVAQSFVLYYIRQIQRNHTGKSLKEIEITE